MQCGIAAMADRVQALETRLPIVATDPNATAADTHVDGDPFTEDSGIDNDPTLFRAFIINVEISTNRLTHTSRKIGTHPTISYLP
jgi:hypothetical protein